jgi:hypothetical protein
VECQHFLDCIKHGHTPVSSGQRGLELVQILEASSASLKIGGGPIDLSSRTNGDVSVRVGFKAPAAAPKRKPSRVAAPKLAANGR